MAGRIPLRPPAGTKTQAQRLGKQLGLRATHQPTAGKFRPGQSNEVMVRAIKRHNKGAPK